VPSAEKIFYFPLSPLHSNEETTPLVDLPLLEHPPRLSGIYTTPLLLPIRFPLFLYLFSLLFFFDEIRWPFFFQRIFPHRVCRSRPQVLSPPLSSSSLSFLRLFGWSSRFFLISSEAFPPAPLKIGSVFPSPFPGSPPPKLNSAPRCPISFRPLFLFHSFLSSFRIVCSHLAT